MNKMCKIMGIVNVTPDSFFDGGKYNNVAAAVDRIHALIEDGAHIIDIGGESTRPGSDPVSAAEEIDRVCPVIEAVAGTINIPLSIDTYKAEVASEALKMGATIINDISAMTFDENMLAVAAKNNASCVLMHIKGTPKNMQNNPDYDDVIQEVLSFLRSARDRAVDAGVKKEKIILDPGIGFGKRLEDNYKILHNLERFHELDQPLLVGLSRKSLIGKLYRGDEDRLPATIALNSIAVYKGASIIRVHDVREHRLALESLAMLQRVS